MWVDNMCPDVNVMTKLGKIGRNSNTPFYTMKDSESITDVLDELRVSTSTYFYCRFFVYFANILFSFTGSKFEY